MSRQLHRPAVRSPHASRLSVPPTASTLVSATAEPVRRPEDPRCGSGRQAARPRLCLCNKNKSTFKEPVWSPLCLCSQSRLPLNQLLINAVVMAAKLSVIQQAASFALVGSSVISTLWTSWAINPSYNSPMGGAIKPSLQVCAALLGHRANTEGIAASVMETCPRAPDTGDNRTLLWGGMMTTFGLKPGGWGGRYTSQPFNRGLLQGDDDQCGHHS